MPVGVATGALSRCNQGKVIESNLKQILGCADQLQLTASKVTYAPNTVAGCFSLSMHQGQIAKQVKYMID